MNIFLHFLLDSHAGKSNVCIFSHKKYFCAGIQITILSFGPLLNLVKPGHCSQLSSNMSLSVYTLNTQKKQSLIISWKRIYIVWILTSNIYDHSYANLELWSPISKWFFFLHTLSNVQQTNASTKLSHLQSYWILMKELTGKSNKQVADFMRVLTTQRIDSDLMTPRSKVVGVLCRIWPTMKIHADTDSTSSNFSHFFCYTLSPTRFT